jgi:hypothetical protein
MVPFSQARSARTRQQFFQTLEPRTHMSATQPNFADFSSTAGLRGTGFGDTALTSRKTLQLTDSGNYESRDVFWTQKVAIDSFTTNFSFVSNKATQSADGFTFTIQNYGTSARGHSGANLGYAGTQFAKSVAVAFNLYNGSAYGSGFGFASGGSTPVTNTDMGSVDLHSGHIMNATVSYNAGVLTVRVVDSTNSRDVFTASEKINIPHAVGGSTAYVGFTAATGLQISTQKILAWSYSGNNNPSITKHARAVPSTVTNNKTTLEVRGTDPGGEDTLTYTWKVVSLPSGAKTPKLSRNGRNLSKNVTVKFYAPGRYLFRCTLLDRNGYSVDSHTVVVTVK